MQKQEIGTEAGIADAQCLLDDAESGVGIGNLKHAGDRKCAEGRIQNKDMTVTISIQVGDDGSQWLSLENHFASLPCRSLIGIHCAGAAPALFGGIGNLLAFLNHHGRCRGDY